MIFRQQLRAAISFHLAVSIAGHRGSERHGAAALDPAKQTCTANCLAKDYDGGALWKGLPEDTCFKCSGPCRAWGGKVCCCTGAGPFPQSRADQNGLTIMNFNTYLLAVTVFFKTWHSKPNIVIRAMGIAAWFNSLSLNQVPDVLVLNEIMSDAAKELMRALCTRNWKKNKRDNMAAFLACDERSKFAFATRLSNPTEPIIPVKEGGVVVLVKNGNKIVSADDTAFGNGRSDDKMAWKGFWAVQMLKGTQEYWIFGTHTQAFEGPDNVRVRRRQFEMIRAYMNDRAPERARVVVPEHARVVVAGDMNIFTDPYLTKEGVEMMEPELESMLEALGSPDVPAQTPHLEPRGFWLELDSSLNFSADAVTNHYVHFQEQRLKSQAFDWVVFPANNDAQFIGPKHAKMQYAPIKSPTCFKSEISTKAARGTYTDDLSDHYAVFAELCYADDCGQLVEPVRDAQHPQHRGASNHLPSNNPFCVGVS
mmetsp:Transcript_8693/g.16472  ORF Transcript_8693/g.16472 Transcript_8693/m.16472 type:complete len:480 (+) Transcript_8693:53-1492(+)